MYRIDEVNNRIISEAGFKSYHSNKMNQTTNPAGQLSTLAVLFDAIGLILDSSKSWTLHHLDGDHNLNNLENLVIIPYDVHSYIHREYFKLLQINTETNINSMSNLDDKLKKHYLNKYSAWMEYYSTYKTIQNYMQKLQQALSRIPKKYKQDYIPDMSEWFKNEPVIPQDLKSVLDTTRNDLDYKEFSLNIIQERNCPIIKLADYKDIIEQIVNETHSVSFEHLFKRLNVARRSGYSAKDYKNNIEPILKSIKK